MFINKYLKFVSIGLISLVGFNIFATLPDASFYSDFTFPLKNVFEQLDVDITTRAMSMAKLKDSQNTVLEFHSLDKKEKKWSYLITMKKTDLISHASNLCSLEVEGVYEEKSIPYAPGLESYSVKSTDCLKLKRNPIKKSVFDNYDNNKTNPSGYFSSTLKMLDDVLVNSKSFIKLGADESAWDIVRNLNVDALVKKDNVYKFTFEVYKSSLNKYSLCNAIAKENQKNYNGFSIESSNCFN